MKRRLFNALTAVSLVLSSALAVLWARSYWRVDLIGYDGRETTDRWQRGGSISSGGGVIGCQWWLRQNDPHKGEMYHGIGRESWPLKAPPSQSNFGVLTFRYQATVTPAAAGPSARRKATGLLYTHNVAVPHWFTMAIAAIPIALWTVRATQRRRRMSRGLCPVCGYDLRASAGRCPECGTAILTPSATDQNEIPQHR